MRGILVCVCVALMLAAATPAMAGNGCCLRQAGGFGAAAFASAGVGFAPPQAVFAPQRVFFPPGQIRSLNAERRGLFGQRGDVQAQGFNEILIRRGGVRGFFFGERIEAR